MQPNERLVVTVHTYTIYVISGIISRWQACLLKGKFPIFVAAPFMSAKVRLGTRANLPVGRQEPAAGYDNFALLGAVQTVRNISY
jgi:hypothetical protein